MFSPFVYPLIACFSSTLLAKPFQATDLHADLDDFCLPSKPSNPPVTSIATLSPLNVSVSNEVSIECNGEKYGFKPDVEDCTSALQHQQVGRTQTKFAQRGSAGPEGYVHLPYRLMGDEALCYLQPVLLNGAESGSASLSQIRDAASDLVLSCASRAEQGGIATNLGGNSNLALILGPYKSDVECRGRFPLWKSCVNIIGGMPTSTETLVYGPVEDAAAQVIVPHFIESDDRKCLGRLWYTKKESDTASWYKIWEAITAVYSVCLRSQQGGTPAVGDHGNLFLTVTPQVRSADNFSLQDTTLIGGDQSISDF